MRSHVLRPTLMPTLAIAMCLSCIGQANQGVAAAPSKPTSFADSPFLSSLNFALSFFKNLRDHTDEAFLRPAQRQDAVKRLTEVSALMNEVVHLNESLEEESRLRQTDNVQRDCARLKGLVQSLALKLDNVIELVPPSDRAEAVKAISEMQGMFHQHVIRYDDIFAAGATPSGHLTDEIHQAVETSFQVREVVNVLITKLAEKDKQ